MVKTEIGMFLPYAMCFGLINTTWLIIVEGFGFVCDAIDHVFFALDMLIGYYLVYELFLRIIVIFKVT